MPYRLASVGIAAFWLVMTGLLIRLEVHPDESTILDVPVSYVMRIMFKNAQQSVLALREGGRTIGTVTLRPHIAGGDRRLLDFSGSFQVPASPRQHASLSGTVRLDKALRVLDFEFEGTLQPPACRLTVQGDMGKQSLQYHLYEERRLIGQQTLPLEMRAIIPALIQQLGIPFDAGALPLVQSNFSAPLVTCRETGLALRGERLDVFQLSMHEGAALGVDLYYYLARSAYTGTNQFRLLPFIRRLAMISTKNLTKHFGSLRAVDDLSLEVAEGEFFAFLGPNAAGKTTTIKLLTGLLQPTAGHCSIGGYNVQSEPQAAKRLLAYVPDFPFLYEKLSCAEFMRFIGEMFEVERTEIPRRTGALFERFGLEPYRHELTENLSHGTRQRLVIASALLHEPKVLIIDEPMVGLDPMHARIVKDELKERSRKGMTVFLSTHQLGMAEELADRIGIIAQGRLLALGTLAELRRQTPGTGALEAIFLSLLAEQEEEPAGDGIA